MMRLADIASYSFHALFYARVRALLMILAMSIGVAAVIVLISLGEAARNYVVSRFMSLGTNLLIVLPGRAETTGAMPPLLGETPRDLTIDDARALLRHPRVKAIAPIVIGNAPVSYRQMEREVSVLGTSASFLQMRRLSVTRGRFLPGADHFRADSVCVLGTTLAGELFGRSEKSLGQLVRIGDSRFRVIGLLGSGGMSIGIDLDDLALIPVASAQSLFNTESLFRIIVEAHDRDAIPATRKEILRLIKERHDGEDDITVITQDAVLATFDRIFNALTLAMAGIAGVSLLVAGILIMNVMLISVSQRTGEIGLLKALGTPSRQVLGLFLAEAVVLSVLGAVLGTITGLMANMALQHVFPDFPLSAPAWAIGAAVVIAVGTGVLFAVLPARQAALLDPVHALSRR